MKNGVKYIFPTLIALSALSVSTSAAFYSVTGLSKLFAGAKLEVTIMAASLEIAKLVIASLLHQYWKELNKILRTYLSTAVVVLVIITSMGIYGFLTAAYQETYRKLTLKENQIEFLSQKQNFFQQDVDRYDQELERISTNISTLSNAKATSIQVRDTTSSSGVRNTISTTELRLAQARIETEEDNRREVQTRRQVAADSLQSYQLKILDVENSMEEVGELGPLQYIANLTGSTMDKVINILLLIIVFVFDPLAISMVIAASFAFKRIRKEEATVEEQAKHTDWEDENETIFVDEDLTITDLTPDPEDLPDLKEEFYDDEPQDIYTIQVGDQPIVSGEDLLNALDQLESNTSGSDEPDWEVVEDVTEEELKDELIENTSKSDNTASLSNSLKSRPPKIRLKDTGKDK
jgi:hypothetical protein